MIALIMSFLFGEEPVHLSSIYWRDDDATQQYWTYPFVPGRRYGDGPVYALISKDTFSAGEEFASILQTRRRATVLGDGTTGGAHPGAAYRLSPHFEAFIPIGRAINPVTRADLEGVGVTPEVPLPQEHAFTAAYYMALRALLERSGNASAGPLQKQAKEIETALGALTKNHLLCAKCGYPNPLYKVRCKNCDERLSTTALNRQT
jgi:C-terminal processing protease CtpA/Prc